MTGPERSTGRTLLRFAERVFDPETVERVLRPAFADLQHECENRDERANAANGVRLRSPLAIRVRAYWGLWKTLAICFVGDAVRVRRGHTLSLGTRTLLCVVLLIVLLTAAQDTTLFFTLRRDHGAGAAMKAFLLLLPSTLTMALPAAFFLALASIRTKSFPVARLIPSATAGAVACAAAIFIGAMFVVPPMNQSFRTFVFNTLQPLEPGVPPRVLSKGLAELTWTELNAQIREPPTSRQEELARAHRQQRFALVASAFVMGLLGLGLAGRWRSRAATIGASLVLLFLYDGCFALAANLDRGALPSIYGTWTVNMAFAVVGLLLLRSRRNRRDDMTSVTG
jgi:hypothetical protein